MTTQLAQLSLDLPGAKLTPTGLSISGALTQAQHKSLVGALRGMIRGLPWCMGDYARACEQEGGMQTMEGLSVAWGVSVAHIRHAAQVSAFYPQEARRPNLTYRHHVDAMRAAEWGAGAEKTGGVELLKGALEILDRAEKEQWGCADLRQATAQGGGGVKPLEPAANPWRELDKADTWATRHGDALKDITKESAATLLVRFRALAETIDKLRKLAGETRANW